MKATETAFFSHGNIKNSFDLFNKKGKETVEEVIKTSAVIDTDILVIGAGTAGVFAAISAARLGARVLLVEKNAMPGGTLSVCGVDYPGLFHAWGRQIIGGPCHESILRAEKLNGAVIPEVVYKPQQHWLMQVRLNTFTYVYVLEKMLLESGVQILYHTMLCDVKETQNGIYAILTCKNENIAVTAHTLIDASGDANAVERLGYTALKSNILQPATLINNLCGYELDGFSESDVDAAFRAALASGELNPRDLQGKAPTDLLRDRRIHMHCCCQTACPESSAGKTALEIEAREAVFRVLSVFRRVKGLENIAVGSFSAECGVRESVRIDAETMITADDYLAGRIYDDAVCYAFYPIDLHTDHGIKQIFLDDGVVPTVPYRALIPKGSSRILAAGRTVGSDTDANSALRVQAPCMAMGQAAGAAAALMARNNTDSLTVDYYALREALSAIGAVLPDLPQKHQ